MAFTKITMSWLLALLAAICTTWQAAQAQGGDCLSLSELSDQGRLLGRNLNVDVVGDFETPGSLEIWYNNPLLANVKNSTNTTEIGTISGSCTLLPGGNNFYCIGDMVLSNGDMIGFAGYSPSSFEIGTLAITGGTGCYNGASGTFLLTALRSNGPYDFYQWEFKFQDKDDDDATSNCTKLEDRFQNQILWEENSNGQILGDYFTVGSVEMWDGSSSITVGSTDGTKIGSSSAVCHLMPDNATEFYCTGAMMFEDTGDIITFSGRTPNSFEVGSFVITGGTGCYQDARGSLNFQAQTVNEQNDYFTWTYVEEYENAICELLPGLLGQGAIEDSSATVALGTGTTRSSNTEVGDRELFYMNELRTGDINGDVLGQTVGVCRLLSGGTHWHCQAEIIFSYGSISVAGSSPKSFEPGFFSIVGGTGCYRQSTGTLSLTALEINEPFDVFEWRLVSEGTNDETAAETTSTAVYMTLWGIPFLATLAAVFV